MPVDLTAAIQEAGNASTAIGLVSQSASLDPEQFAGVWAVSGTYGAFTPLMYTPARVWSQQNQDSKFRTGVLHILAGHSGPETAADARTHFGIFAPQVWKLFPRDQVINLSFWDYNDVAPGYFAAAEIAARDKKVGLLVIEVARPDFRGADRTTFADSDLRAAAKGLYVIRDFAPGQPRHGYVVAQGSSSTFNLVSVLPRLTAAGIDARYQPRPDLTGLFSIAPDFSQIARQLTDLNFSYTEKLRPDPRPFFAEGRGFFGPSDFFYSNRVPDFDVGGKLFGRQGHQRGPALAHEQRVLPHADRDVEVAGRTATPGSLALAAQLQARRVVDTRGNADVQLVGPALRAAAAARGARVGDHLTLPVAVTARLGDREEALLEAHLPRAPALRADFRLRARPRPSPAARLAGRQARHRDRLVAAEGGLLEREVQPGVGVGPSGRTSTIVVPAVEASSTVAPATPGLKAERWA